MVLSTTNVYEMIFLNISKQTMLFVIFHMIAQGPLLLTWFNFNPSMDK